MLKVHDKKDTKKIYAVKVEKKERKHSKLRMEVGNALNGIYLEFYGFFKFMFYYPLN